MRKRLVIACAAMLGVALFAAVAVSAKPPATTATVTPGWVTGLASGSGSTVGPDGALYVPEPTSGKVYRVDPQTGGPPTEVAHCLPPRTVLPFGGAMDVAFAGKTLYALVAAVSEPNPDFSGLIGFHPDHPNGIYRIDGPGSCTPVADIGAFADANRPDADIVLWGGVQYAMEPYRGGFLVTDGHHNRIYRVMLGGEVSEFAAFGNVVPTGLAVQGNTIHLAEAGDNENGNPGKVVAIDAKSGDVTDVAGFAPLLVDVERGRGQTLFGLAQGTGSPGPGAPAAHGTGRLVRVDGNGGFSDVATGLDQPTSLEIIGTTAYVVTYGGAISKIDNIAGPPYGNREVGSTVPHDDEDNHMMRGH